MNLPKLNPKIVMKKGDKYQKKKKTTINKQKNGIDKINDTKNSSLNTNINTTHIYISKEDTSSETLNSKKFN